MSSKTLLGFVFAFALVIGAPALVWAAESGEVPLENQPPLPEGTVITTQNWQQYKDYMPMYMQILFSGEYGYKLAPDQHVVVTAAPIKPYPKEYEKNTE